MKIAAEYIDINKIKPAQDNPRINDHVVHRVAESIKSYGFGTPIVTQLDGTILAGHTRYKAAKMLGLTEIPCRKLDISGKKAKLYRLADNRLSELAEWNDDFLLQELEELQTDYSFELENMGFNIESIDMDSSFEDMDWSPSEEGPVEEGSEEEGSEEEKIFIFSKEEIIKDAFNYFRRIGFPYPILDIFQMKQQINKIANTSLERCLRSTVGYRVPDTFHGHRFHASAINMKSPVESFKIDKNLRKALSMIYESGNIQPKLNGWFMLVNGTQACANFRPAYARLIYDKYCPEGGIVFDSSTGYGGRLTGFLASRCQKYIGIDPNTKTHEANLLIFETLKNNNKECLLINKPAEDVDIKKHKIKGVADLAFTSPPYFKKEIYSEESTQSCNRYPEYEDWIDNFLFPMMRLNYQVVKKNGLIIINIENIKISGKEFELVKKTIEAGKKSGLTFLRKEEFALPKRSHVSNDEVSETVLFFKKE